MLSLQEACAMVLKLKIQALQWHLGKKQGDKQTEDTFLMQELALL